MPHERAAQERKNARVMLIGGLLILLVGGSFIGRTFWDKSHDDPSKDQAETPAADDEKDAIPTLSAEVIRQKLYNGDTVVFLDTRDKESFDAEHIPHSRLTSPGALASFVPAESETTIIVYSTKDPAMKETLSNILKQKASPAYLLQGGFEEWKQSGNQVLSHGDPNSFLDQSKVTYITPQEVFALVNDGFSQPLLLDVQPKQEYEKKHLLGAINIPLPEIEKRVKEIPPSRTIIVYGESDLVSFQAGVRLADLNIFMVRTLQGDFRNPEFGFPLEP